jgi:hypothetical protein
MKVEFNIDEEIYYEFLAKCNEYVLDADTLVESYLRETINNAKKKVSKGVQNEQSKNTK